MNYGYQWIWELKKRLGKKSIEELLVMTPRTDPFYWGVPKNALFGQWFFGIWKKLGLDKSEDKPHLRRIHYAFGSTVGAKRVTKVAYEFNDKSWEELGAGARQARYMGLIPPDRLTDHRNDPPHLPDIERATFGTWPMLSKDELPLWELPAIHLDFPEWDMTLEAPVVYGYEPDDVTDRAYQLEVFIEKTTMDDILIPLCQELGVTLNTSSGNQSITNAVGLLKRVHASQKPCRVFYIVDRDKRGLGMPGEFARQVEFWRERYAPDSDVKVMHLALTSEQVAYYKLPVAAKRQVELDALEATHPGELAKIVRRAVAPYLDRTLPERLKEAQSDADESVEDEWEATAQPHEQELAKIHRKLQASARRFERDVKRINQAMQKEIAPYRERLRQLEDEVQATLDEFGTELELPKRPEPELCSNEKPEQWLFDSSRDYLIQLESYRQHKAKRWSKG